MGCDIHAWIEVKYKEEWVLVDDLGVHRNYELFADMAGVRGNGPEPRGLPEDVSKGAQWRSEQWGADGHSHSWLYALEFLALIKRTKEYGRYIEEYKEEMLQEMADRIKTRVVFFFDN